MTRTDTRPRRDHRHLFEFHVRFGDLDPLGHVNNCKVFEYLQDARLEMFRSDPIREGGEPLHGLVIARHEVDYKRPMLLGIDPLRVETWITELRTGSFRLAYEIRDDEHLYITAASVVVAYNVEAARPRRFTTAETAFLERYLDLDLDPDPRRNGRNGQGGQADRGGPPQGRPGSLATSEPSPGSSAR